MSLKPTSPSPSGSLIPHGLSGAPAGGGASPSAVTDCTDDHCECPAAAGQLPRPPRPLTSTDRARLDRLAKSLEDGKHGVLHLASHPGFDSFTRLFNRAILSPAVAVVRPLTTQGVSLALAAADEAGWSVSVKGGGYGTNGWAAQGDLVVDLARLNEVEVHLPDEATGKVDAPPFAQSVAQASEEARKRDAETQEGSGKGKVARAEDDSLGTSSTEDRSDDDARPPVSRTRSAPDREKTTAEVSRRTSASEPVRADASGTTTAGGPSAVATPPSAHESASTTPPSLSSGGEAKPTTNGWTPPTDVLWHSPVSASSFALPPRSVASAMEVFRPLEGDIPVASTSALPPPMTSTAAGSSWRPQAGRSAQAGPDPAELDGSAPTGLLSQVPALVTFGCGVRTKELSQKTAKLGYYVPTSAFPVGAASISTGGFGFLSRLCGLSMDNVVAAEIVLASGRVVRLEGEPEPGSEEERLWWMFRGCGTALGVVTRVRCRAFKIGLVYAANIIYPFNRVTAPSLMRHWRDCLKSAPPELYTNFILTAGQNPDSSVVVIQLCLFGPQRDGDWFVSALTAWEGERPLLQDVGLCTMVSQLDKVALVLDANASSHSANRWCIRSDVVSTLTDQTIADTCKQFVNISPRSAWIFELAGQAVAEVAAESSCYPLHNRRAPFTVAAIHQWPDPSDDAAWIDAAKSWIDDTISPHSPGGPIPCFLETRTEKARFVKTFGGAEGWRRLKAIKREVDPKGMFRWTLWPETDSDKLAAGETA